MEIKWTEKYSVNNALLDLQHRQLFSIINRFSHEIEAGNGQLVLQEILEDMSKYAWMHFRTEEDLLFKSDYKALSEHKALHDAFKHRLIELAEMSDEDIALKIEAVHRFLRSWLTAHILNEDVKYVQQIKS